MAINKSVYDHIDTRLDLYEINTSPVPDAAKEGVLELASSVACMVTKDQLIRNAAGGYQIPKDLPTLKITKNLGGKEQYPDQPVLPYCTVFWLNGPWALTALHCVGNIKTNSLNEADIQATRLLFNYKMLDPTQYQQNFSDDDVYSIEEIAAFGSSNTASDWALLRLSRPVVGKQPPKLDFNPIANKATLSVIGYPSGLPAKWAHSGSVEENIHPQTFKAKLTTFAGNSGSPIYTDQKKICGILIRGQRDYDIVHNYDDTGKSQNSAYHVKDGEGFEECQRLSSISFINDYIQADAGDPQAQYQVGLYYLNGSHNIVNKDKAMTFFEKAAYQGHDLAQQEFNKLSEDKLETINPASPRYQRAVEGLNFVFSCSNSACESNGSDVYVPRGKAIGDYLDVRYEKLHSTCTACGQKVNNLKSLLFSNCTYQLEGDRIIPSTTVVNRTAQVSAQKYKVVHLENHTYNYLRVKTS